MVLGLEKFETVIESVPPLINPLEKSFREAMGYDSIHNEVKGVFTLLQYVG